MITQTGCGIMNRFIAPSPMSTLPVVSAFLIFCFAEMAEAMNPPRNEPSAYPIIRNQNMASGAVLINSISAAWLFESNPSGKYFFPLRYSIMEINKIPAATLIITANGFRFIA